MEESTSQSTINPAVNQKPRNRRLLMLFIALLGGVSIFAIISSQRVSAESQNTLKNSSATTSTTVTENKKKPIGSTFKFPIAGTKPALDIQYTLDSAELTNQIVINGQRAFAVPGRQFLLVNLKLTNSSTQDVTINTRNYVRLTANTTSKEWIAPDIHNDPVVVQAISTKYTRIGFPVNSGDKNFTLQVGDITGSKKDIKVDF